MTVKLEQLPGEPIFITVFDYPFDAKTDIKQMFTEFTPLRATIKGAPVLILDVSFSSRDPQSFNQMVLGLAEAAAQIRIAKTHEDLSPPQLIFVGTGDMVTIAAGAIGQTQYGGSKARAFASRDEAVQMARTMLLKPEENKDSAT